MHRERIFFLKECGTFLELEREKKGGERVREREIMREMDGCQVLLSKNPAFKAKLLSPAFSKYASW